MRIDPGQFLSKLPGIQKSSGKRRTTGTEPLLAGKRDQVELSKTAQELLQLREQLAQVPEIRKEKVEALRVSIHNGTYRPDVRAIADRILQSGALDD